MNVKEKTLMVSVSDEKIYRSRLVLDQIRLWTAC